MVAETLILNKDEVILMQFTFNPEVPKQSPRPQQQRESNVDWDKVNEYQASVLGIGKHSLIGRIVQLYDLGLQERQEKSIPWDATGQQDHGWRLEINPETGLQKDPSAKIEMGKYKGKEQEILTYKPTDVSQMAIAVDFPEKMMNLSQFFNPEGEQVEKPFRDIIGQNGFGGFRIVDGNRVSVIARPFNLAETNVNRNKKDAPYHSAFAKNGMLYELADYCGALAPDGNFHIADLTNLIGKVCMFEVEVKWNEWKDKKSGETKRKLETDIKPSARMSPRDEAYYNSDLKPKLDDDVLGGLLFQGGNRERDLKEARAIVINTMSLAKNWNESKLKAELEATRAGGQQSPSQKPVEAPEKHVAASSQSANTVVAPQPVNASESVSGGFDDSFDDDNYPF